MDAEVPNSLRLLFFAFCVLVVGVLGYMVYLENTRTYDSDYVIINRSKALETSEQLN